MIRKRTTITAAAARQTGRILKIATPRVFLPLLQSSARYKGAYGGRGSGKSHFFAELLIEECLAQRGMLAVCVREIQKSLKDSSKRLIEVKLRQLGLGEADGFKVFEKQIQTPGDGVIIFTGLRMYKYSSSAFPPPVPDRRRYRVQPTERGRLRKCSTG